MSRFVTGWGTGLVQTSLTVYVAEIAPTSVRSTMLTVYSGWFALGQFAASVAVKVVNDSGTHWRNAFLSQLVFVGLFSASDYSFIIKVMLRNHSPHLPLDSRVAVVLLYAGAT